MVLGRLVNPGSEHAVPGWVNRTALSDLTGVDFSNLSDDTLYRHLDRLHPRRTQIEETLFRKAAALFQLDTSVYLSDLTSTYFEGNCPSNPHAQRGYSRDQRGDAKQVVVGVTFNRDGFPLAHEGYEGNRADVTTLPPLLAALERRRALTAGKTVVMDRGLASTENLALLRKHDLHYLVAGRGSERDRFLAEWQAGEEGFQELTTGASGRILLKQIPGEGETFVWVKSEGRREKDRAIREKQEERFCRDVTKLTQRIEQGRLKKTSLIERSIGRLQERYPRVARYYALSYQENSQKLLWREKTGERTRAEELDGSYLLKTDRQDLCAEEIWRTYTLLSRAENAFRDMKSPLSERPIFHQLTHRT